MSNVSFQHPVKNLQLPVILDLVRQIQTRMNTAYTHAIIVIRPLAAGWRAGLPVAASSCSSESV